MATSALNSKGLPAEACQALQPYLLPQLLNKPRLCVRVCTRFARWREHIWQGVIVWTTMSHFLFLPPRVKPDLDSYDASQQPWPTVEPIRFELSAVYILFISFALVVRP